MRPEKSHTSLEDTTIFVDGEAAPHDEAATARGRGDILGRYVITDRLGTGGMGVVFAAYDTELDRRVALKLLRVDRKALQRKEAEARLVREAKTVARLNHQNVVTIYDVETIDDQVVVAMELVDGETLAQWLEEERTWQEVVPRFLAAGRGLAAAHTAGIVHRDFKPSNVLIGRDDGRVRVLDFGLARPATDRVSTGAVDEPEAEADLIITRVTATGIVMGTPLYMSPEQHFGGKVDARSDQFAFCVALYRALYRQRPFTGTDRKTLAKATRQGPPREPPKSSGVPGWLRAAVFRGLSATPEERFASMDDLLVTLQRDPQRTRQRVAMVAVGGLALLGAGAGLRGFSSDRAPGCDGANEALASAWGDARRTEVQTAITGLALPYASATWERIEPPLDTYAQDWHAAHREACLATARGEQSERLLDRRMACLERRRQELDALTELLTVADESTLQNAVTAVAGLSPVATCADVQRLVEDSIDPENPEMLADVRAIRTQIGRLKAHVAAGKFGIGLPLATAALADAEATEHAPTIAEARYWLGMMQAGAGDAEPGLESMVQAELGARASGHDALSATALPEIVYQAGHVLEKPDAAMIWGRQAMAALNRVDADDGQRGRLLNRLGNLHERLGDYPQAQASYQEAVERITAWGGADHPEVARAFNNLGNVSFRQGEFTTARSYYERARATWARALGEDHPDAIMPINNLANVALKLGQTDEALERLESVLASWEKSLGADHYRLAIPLTNIATLLRGRARDLERALELDQRALEVRTAQLGDEHPAVGQSLGGIGMTLKDMGRPAEAVQHYRKAIAISEKAYGPDHISLATDLSNMALALSLLPDKSEAEEVARRGLAIREKHLGPDSPIVAHSTYVLAVVYRRLQRPGDARAQLERTVALRENAEGELEKLSNPLFELAQVYRELGEPEARVRQTALRARGAFERGNALDEVAAVDAFLADGRADRLSSPP